MNKVEFGQWVRAQREGRNWSQSDLAREAGLHRSHINGIENGVSEAAPKTLLALANAFGHDPQYLYELVGYLPPKPELSPLKRALIHKIETDHDLPESDLQMVDSIIEQRKEFYKKNPQAKPLK